MSLHSLILIGGRSSRMGVPKHTLLLQSNMVGQQAGQPLLVHLLLGHHEFQLTLGHTMSQVCISARDEHQKEEVKQLLSLYELPKNMNVHHILDEHVDSGPAAGLLAAYAYDQTVSWLVSGCDYPLLSVASFKQLHKSHNTHGPAVTCFVNDDGFAEPLLAIWTPPALRFMNEMAATARSENRKLGPTGAIRALEREPLINGNVLSGHHTNINLIKPLNASWLTNVNTMKEWHESQSLA